MWILISSMANAALSWGEKHTWKSSLITGFGFFSFLWIFFLSRLVMKRNRLVIQKVFLKWNKSLFSFVWHHAYACFKKLHKIPTQLLSCLYGFITQCKKKRKKIDAAGTKFLFVLYPGFMWVNWIPSVSHQPLWQCGLVGGWRRKNEFDTAGIDRFKYDFPVCFLAYLQSLFNFEEVFLLKWKPNASVFCVQCGTMPAVWTHPQ